MNVASTELAPTPSIVPGRAAAATGNPTTAGGIGELSGFLSLVIGFLEKNPASSPSQIEPPHSTPSDTTAAAGARKDKTKDPEGSLNEDTKKHSKEELAAVALPAHPLQESPAFFMKPPSALGFPAAASSPELASEQANLDENRNDSGSMQNPATAPNPSASPLSSLTEPKGDIAFTLRLTSNDSGTKSSVLAAPRSGMIAPTDQSARPVPISRQKNALTSEPRAMTGAGSADQLAQKESKTEPVAKLESPGFHLNDRHVEGNATTLEVPARPPDAAGAPNTGLGRPTVEESSARRIVSEPEIKIGLAPPSTRQISLKLSTDDTTRVNVDLTERAGKVLVAVRATDHEIAQSLQTDLGDLVGRLESKGFKTETWIPTAAHPVAVASHPSNSNPRFGQPQHSSSGNGGGQQRQGQNGSNQRQQARWTAEMKQTVSANEVRSERQ